MALLNWLRGLSMENRKPIREAKSRARRSKGLGRWRRSRLAVEHLEDRVTPSVSSSLSGSALTVNLGQANDHAYLEDDGITITVADNSSFTVDAAYATYSA